MLSDSLFPIIKRSPAHAFRFPFPYHQKVSSTCSQIPYPLSSKGLQHMLSDSLSLIFKRSPAHAFRFPIPCHQKVSSTCFQNPYSLSSKGLQHLRLHAFRFPIPIIKRFPELTLTCCQIPTYPYIESLELAAIHHQTTGSRYEPFVPLKS